jgi:hypothetical protein
MPDANMTLEVDTHYIEYTANPELKDDNSTKSINGEVKSYFEDYDITQGQIDTFLTKHQYTSKPEDTYSEEDIEKGLITAHYNKDITLTAKGNIGYKVISVAQEETLEYDRPYVKDDRNENVELRDTDESTYEKDKYGNILGRDFIYTSPEYYTTYFINFQPIDYLVTLNDTPNTILGDYYLSNIECARDKTHPEEDHDIIVESGDWTTAHYQDKLTFIVNPKEGYELREMTFTTGLPGEPLEVYTVKNIITVGSTEDDIQISHPDKITVTPVLWDEFGNVTEYVVTYIMNEEAVTIDIDFLNPQYTITISPKLEDENSENNYIGGTLKAWSVEYDPETGEVIYDEYGDVHRIEEISQFDVLTKLHLDIEPNYGYVLYDLIIIYTVYDIYTGEVTDHGRISAMKDIYFDIPLGNVEFIPIFVPDPLN